MKYYAVMHGIQVRAVPPQYTSQDCSSCGERVKKTLSTRTHVCPKCELVIDRDENAAVNILQQALKERTVGHTGTCEAPVPRTLGERRPLLKSRKTVGQVASMNQEPPVL